MTLRRPSGSDMLSQRWGCFVSSVRVWPSDHGMMSVASTFTACPSGVRPACAIFRNGHNRQPVADPRPRRANRDMIINGRGHMRRNVKILISALRLRLASKLILLNYLPRLSTIPYESHPQLGATLYFRSAHPEDLPGSLLTIIPSAGCQSHDESCDSIQARNPSKCD
jgi:hypothetical protein